MKRFLMASIASLGLLRAASVADLYTTGDLAAIRAKLEKKRTSFAKEDLKRYGNHYTMVAYREATGSSEIHEHEADIFVVQKGAGSIVIGGKMEGGHQTAAGELRGTSINGGEKLPLKAGDIIHIPAGVPHQILVTSGDPITYFVVKVTGQ